MCECKYCQNCCGDGFVWIASNGDYLGKARKDSYDEMEDCSLCNGTGLVEECSACQKIVKTEGV